MKKLGLTLLFAMACSSLVAAGPTMAPSGQIMLPVISCSHSSVDFGDVPVNAVLMRSIVISNLSTDMALTVDAVKTRAPFYDGSASSFTIAPNSSRRVDVFFAPQAAGQVSSQLCILSNAHNAPRLDIPLTGNGTI